MKKLNKSIRKIQNSDERTKTSWLWGLTISISLIVIIIWFNYLNLNIEKISYKEIVNITPTPSFLATFRLGLESLKDQVANGLNIILSERAVDIEIAKQDFVYKDLNRIPITQLP